MTDNTLNRWIRAYAAAEAAEKAAKAEKEKARAAIAAELETRGREDYTGAGYTVKNKLITSTRFDAAAFKAAAPAVYAAYMVTNTAPRFTFKKAAGK